MIINKQKITNLKIILSSYVIFFIAFSFAFVILNTSYKFQVVYLKSTQEERGYLYIFIFGLLYACVYIY